jgi:hypothetical protein
VTATVVVRFRREWHQETVREIVGTRPVVNASPSHAPSRMADRPQARFIAREYNVVRPTGAVPTLWSWLSAALSGFQVIRRAQRDEKYADDTGAPPEQ